MKVNNYLIQSAVAIIIAFGGSLVIRYVITGEFLLGQIMGASVGILLLIPSLIWGKVNK